MLRRAKIAILFTGGTISMTHGSEHGAAVPTLSGENICALVDGLQKRFDVHSIEFSRIPGPHMTSQKLLELHACIRQVLNEGAEGVVITHGTDTLEESAFFLDLLHEDKRPVVLVGAMRTSDDLSWDGPVNLFGACLLAGDPKSCDRGVMVLMNNTIHAASEVTKTYTEAVDTFISPDTGAMGIIDMGKVIFYRNPVRRMLIKCHADRKKHHLNPSSPLPRVELLEAVLGMDAVLIEAVMQSDAQALVLAAMGRGNLPPSMAKAVEKALKQGLTVLVTSRCWGGRVAPISLQPSSWRSKKEYQKKSSFTKKKRSNSLKLRGRSNSFSVGSGKTKNGQDPFEILAPPQPRNRALSSASIEQDFLIHPWSVKKRIAAFFSPSSWPSKY